MIINKIKDIKIGRVFIVFSKIKNPIISNNNFENVKTKRILLKIGIENNFIFFLKGMYYGDEKFRAIKTLFTIHNIEYQGIFGMDTFGSLFGFPDSIKNYVDINTILISIFDYHVFIIQF